MATKPADHTDWIGTLFQTPSAGKKSLGWEAGERPPAEFFNYLFRRQDEWNKYFEEVTDALLSPFDAIIGDTGSDPAATHDTLQEAVDDVALGSNVSVLVRKSETVNTTIGLVKPGWRIQCQPGVVYTKGSALQGINIGAADIQFLNGRFVGFTGGSDEAINISAAGVYAQILFTRFGSGTNVEIDDSSVPAGQKPVILGTISEV